MTDRNAINQLIDVTTQQAALQGSAYLLIDPLPRMTNPEVINQLTDLGAQLQVDEQLTAYLLIDPLLRDPFAGRWMHGLGGEVTIIPVRSAVLQQHEQPRLIRLAPQNVELLGQSLFAAHDEQSDPLEESVRGFSMGGWLTSAATAEDLSRHLSQMMDRSVFIEGQWRYFRWADRRVFEWMWPVLTPVQRGRLMGPIAAWHTLNRHGDIDLYAAPEGSPGEVARHASLQLERDQEAHAQHCELIQHIMRGWHAMTTQLPADYRPRIVEAFDEVIALGLENPQDIVLLMNYALQIHPRLSSHPRIKTLIAEANNNALPLAGLREAVSMQEWGAIEADLKANGPHPAHSTFK